MRLTIFLDLAFENQFLILVSERWVSVCMDVISPSFRYWLLIKYFSRIVLAKSLIRSFFDLIAVALVTGRVVFCLMGGRTWGAVAFSEVTGFAMPINCSVSAIALL